MTRSELKQLIRETIEEVQTNPPIKIVIDMKTKKPIGYFQYGKGFIPSEQGKSMGYKADNKVIPDFTYMVDEKEYMGNN